MANKRMFTMKICDSDAFLDMPLSTQCLYFHLCMRADDDGFISNPKRIQRLTGASDDDLKLLIAKRFVLTFDDGVMVIKHWRMHNTIQRDRYTPTVYQEEMTKLLLKDNKSYSFNTGNILETKRKQIVSPDIDIDLGIDKGIGIDKDIEKHYQYIFVSYYKEPKILELLEKWYQLRQEHNKPVDEKTLRRNLEQLEYCAEKSRMTVIEYLENLLAKGWFEFCRIATKEKTKAM